MSIRKCQSEIFSVALTAKQSRSQRKVLIWDVIVIVTRPAMLAAVTVHTVVFNVHLAPTILYLYL